MIFLVAVVTIYLVIRLEVFMTELDALSAKVDQVIALVQSLKAQDLSPAAQAKVAEITAKLESILA